MIGNFSLKGPFLISSSNIFTSAFFANSKSEVQTLEEQKRDSQRDITANTIKFRINLMLLPLSFHNLQKNIPILLYFALVRLFVLLS